MCWKSAFTPYKSPINCIATASGGKTQQMEPHGGAGKDARTRSGNSVVTTLQLDVATDYLIRCVHEIVASREAAGGDGASVPIGFSIAPTW